MPPMLVDPVVTPEPSVMDVAAGPPPQVAVKVNVPPGKPVVLPLTILTIWRSPAPTGVGVTERGSVTVTVTVDPPTITTADEGLYVAAPQEAFNPGFGVLVSTTVQLVPAESPERVVDPTV